MSAGRWFVDPVSKKHPITAIDGDTVKLTLERAFNAGPLPTALRLAGLDTPEKKNTRLGGMAEKRAGLLVRDVVVQWLADRRDQVLYHTSDARPKFYGRTVGRLIAGWPTHDAARDDCLNRYLLDNGLARPYSGARRKPWTKAELALITVKANALLRPSN